MLAVDGVVAGREDAVAPLDVRLLQRQHRFAQREAAVVVVGHCASEGGIGETLQVEEGLEALGEDVHPGSAALDERFAAVQLSNLRKPDAVRKHEQDHRPEVGEEIRVDAVGLVIVCYKIIVCVVDPLRHASSTPRPYLEGGAG